MSGGDLDIGMLVLVANEHWKRATWIKRLAAWLFGRHQVVEHLGCRLRLSFLHGTPFLLSIRELADG